MIKKINEELNYKSYLKLITETKYTVVVFYTEWCTFCNKMLTTLENIVEDYPGVPFYKINKDENEASANSLSVFNIPIVLVYKYENDDVNEVLRLVGYVEEDRTKEYLNKHLKGE